jgi:hypothetical protein
MPTDEQVVDQRCVPETTMENPIPYMLNFGPEWAVEIAKIRDDVTDDTNLIRFDNSFYRICRAQSEFDSFKVNVRPSAQPHQVLPLTFRTRDLYVSAAANVKFEQYQKTLNSSRFGLGIIDNAVQTVLKSRNDSELQKLVSLIVWAVAESLRDDHMETRLGQTMRASLGGLVGVGASCEISETWEAVHSWGRTSDAIFRTLSPEMLKIVQSPKDRLTIEQRRRSERVDLERLPPVMRAHAIGYKTLKSPG